VEGLRDEEIRMRPKRKSTIARRKLSERRPVLRAMESKIASRPFQSIVFVEDGETDRSTGSYAPASHPLSIRRIEEDDDQD
jgi:hypothetical protein